MTRNTAPIHVAIAISVLFLLKSPTWADDNAEMTPTRIEIFTSSNQPISRSAQLVKDHDSIDVRTHTLDAIRGLEETLSQDLPADPDEAKRLVLKRLQELNNEERIRLEHSATALAKAVQLGVEKYPAIVFDGELVVYGLTDLSVGLMHYQSWQRGKLQ